jgi:WD40 repeat protein
MKRIAIVASLLLTFLAACKDNYVGDNPIGPSGSMYSLASVGEDNTVSMVNADGSNLKTLVSAGSSYRRLIDAVGDLVAFSEAQISATGATETISVVNVRTNNVTQLVEFTCDPSENQFAPPMATLTPDGRLVVLSMGPLQQGFPNGDSTHLYVNVVPTDKGDFPGATSAFVDVDLPYGFSQMTRPVCSPDGSRIAFCYTVGGKTSRLVTIGPDGTGLRDAGQVGVAYTLADRNAGPTWSPDGTRLAIVGEEGTSIDLYDPDAGKIGSIPAYPDGAHTVAAVVWSPTGSQFAAVLDGWTTTNSPYRGYRIYGVGTDGTLANLVAFGHPGMADSAGYMDYFCDWSPNGKQLAFLGQANLSGMDKGYNLYVTNPVDQQVRSYRLTQGHVKDALWMRPAETAL